MEIEYSAEFLSYWSLKIEKLWIIHTPMCCRSVAKIWSNVAKLQKTSPRREINFIMKIHFWSQRTKNKIYIFFAEKEFELTKIYKGQFCLLIKFLWSWIETLKFHWPSILFIWMIWIDQKINLVVTIGFYPVCFLWKSKDCKMFQHIMYIKIRLIITSGLSWRQKAWPA